MIEVDFEKVEKRRTIFQKFRQRRMQKKRICKVCYREILDEEVAVFQLPCTYEEAGMLGKAWFLECVRKIKEQYPRQLLYFTEDVCRKYQLAQYRKRWICWYCLFEELWKMAEQQYQWEVGKERVVLIDTGDGLVQQLSTLLVGKAQEIYVVTHEAKAWQAVAAKLEEEGMFLQFCESKEMECSGTILIDVMGEWYRQYGKLQKKNDILAWGMNREKKAYLESRAGEGHVLCGLQQSIHGELVNEKLAAIFMQSHNWKLRQLADTQEIVCGRKELENIRNLYEWKLEGIETLHKGDLH